MIILLNQTFYFNIKNLSVRNNYPRDSKRNFLSRVNDFSRIKRNNFILIPISFPNWSLINLALKWYFFFMEIISFCYKRIFFLKVAKFRYLLTKFLVQNDFPFGARGNGSNVCFFFCDSLSEARVVMWLKRRLPNPKVESSIPGDYNF